MFIQLFYSPGSCSLAPHILMEEIGLPFEPVSVDMSKKQQSSSNYLRINPKGRVPVLIHDEHIITENAAILRYIAALSPEKKLWPDKPLEEARCAEWLSWLSSTHHPAYRHVLRPERFAISKEGIADVVTVGRATTRECWEMIENKLEDTPWLLGDHFTAADAYLLVYWMWGRGKTLGYDMPKDFPKWTDHAKRMAGRPSVQRALAREGIPLP